MSSTILTGGPVRTMTDDGHTPEAVLIHDGVVRAVGTLTEMRRSAYETPEIVDLDGRTLMPGFVDAHAHTILHGSAIDWVNLSGARGIGDIVRLLAERAAARPGEAVRGYGYDQSKLVEGRHPSAADLDRVTRDRVVQIQHASGHGYVVNTLALRQANITAATPTPPGGRIDRDADGEPTGVLFDSACDLLTGAEGVKVRNHGPNFHLPMTHAEIDHLFDLGQRSLLAAGITTMCDAQVTQLEMDAYLRARDEGRLRMRTEMLALSSNLEHLTGLGMSSRLGDDQLRLWGVKLYADGSVIARTAYLNGHACCGKPSPDGYLYHEPEELAALITTAHRLGLSTATHAQGPLPIGVVLDAVADARAERPRTGLVHRIEHCGFPTGEQIGRMADLYVVPVPQPMQVSLYGDSLMDEFGEFGGRFYPYGEFERAGVPVVISSDAPVTMPNPLEAVWAAVTRETLGGAVSGDAAQQAGRANALRGVTVTPARMLGRQDIGVIRPGARADLVFLDADPVTVPVERLPKVGVTESWIGGEEVVLG
ncbi:amidohydrolase [Streptomyces sp. SID10815]|uniref:amidohydrolase n=1 Tax=Streptomyces sp. SID10815 TaxID=2706027 RepID=UPI0013CC4C1B|nr:amidohydrolase [Streptomyces sp. SID10815]NEA45678.1 amidohydrolase [Streptomyces sp. SID10815]